MTQNKDFCGNTSAADSVPKLTEIAVDDLREIEKTNLMNIPTIKTISLDPDHRGIVQLSTPLFYSRALERGFRVISGDSWATDVRELGLVEALGLVALKVSYQHSQHSVIELPDALLKVFLDNGRTAVTVAGCTMESVAEVVARVRLLLPTKVKSDAVSMTFLSAEYDISRSLVVPTWDGIKTNYPASVQEKVTSLIERGPKQLGRLLLWHGLPGTGKTYALRALAKEWQDWCDVQYILDPERFFGASTDYMMSTLLSGVREPDDAAFKWRLLVAEDTGELLAKDAKTQVGQGLSRLLNMVDGLIGQGLQTMVLITTNEQLEGMHEAVTRPGRTGSIIEFMPFSPDEANDWLRRNGKGPIEDRKARTLAELFAGAPARKGSIGFVADGLRKTA